MATIPVNNPEIPFLGEIPGGFNPGMIIRIRGRVLGFDNWWVLILNCEIIATSKNFVITNQIFSESWIIVLRWVQHPTLYSEHHYK